MRKKNQHGPNRSHRFVRKTAGTRLGTAEIWRGTGGKSGKAPCNYGVAVRDGR